MNLKQLRQALDRKKGRQQENQDNIKACRGKIRLLRQEYVASEKAHALIQTIAQQTQTQLQYQLSELPILALQGVFDDPYGFEVAFELSRGKTEANFWFKRGGERLSPRESTGLGAVDVAGVALRPSLWSLRQPRNRACIWLDEPFKHLKGVETNTRALQMLKGICTPKPDRNWPGIQIIMIADERAPREELLAVADRVFEFSIKNRESIVKKLK
jgi:hypothetical protein